MAITNWNARARARKKGGAIRSICAGLALGIALGYGILHLSEVASAREYACSLLPALSGALSCYE
jgi:hypothetical protein